MTKIINVNDFVNRFFETAEKLGYDVEVCKRGEARGKKQIDFGNKKLHELHLRKLYPMLIENGIDFSYDAFNDIVPGRPCAVKGFREISATIVC
ncbi:hypothetical protein HWN40_10375 [Methanolobus zinderi]|uniref:Uncharacterized protein n=1 Tax=Methanolobus zinderi TaxID=536044 RepID=A0A7D5I5L4_9EURY|nr:hypothetical protein [Methanolobus zinderi]QLC50604.1 hypothetical protein HWN40_10375 [Methanolobus zinderi]